MDRTRVGTTARPRVRRSLTRMTLVISVPGRASIHLDHLLLDVNGTLTNRGHLIEGVGPRIAQLQSRLTVHLLTADTFGTLVEVAEQLGGVDVARISDGADKAAFATDVGAGACAAIGNGANDELMLRTVALGIAVLGPEGTARQTLLAADLVVPTILAALDLLLEPQALAATLRS